jgi:hypothetical protein
MLEDDFDELEIAKVDDLEFHIDDDDKGDSRLVLLTTDSDGDRHAIVLPFSEWQFLSDALNEALAKFPDGGQVH